MTIPFIWSHSSWVIRVSRANADAHDVTRFLSHNQSIASLFPRIVGTDAAAVVVASAREQNLGLLVQHLERHEFEVVVRHGLMQVHLMMRALGGVRLMDVLVMHVLHDVIVLLLFRVQLWLDFLRIHFVVWRLDWLLQRLSWLVDMDLWYLLLRMMLPRHNLWILIGVVHMVADLQRICLTESAGICLIEWRGEREADIHYRRYDSVSSHEQLFRHAS